MNLRNNHNPNSQNTNKITQPNFYQEFQNYGDRLIKGVTRDQVLKQLKKIPILMKYYLKNNAQIKQRVVDTLMRQPSVSDCPGFIYGFRELNQYKLHPNPQKYDIKMGRTKRQVPQDRIFQWQKDDQHKYVEIFTIRTQNNYKLESLVHLFFAYARKIKFVNGKRRIEWFTFEQSTQNAAATSLINQLMQKIHNLGKINESRVQEIMARFDFGKLLVELNKQVGDVEKFVKRFVLIGLKKCGKSVVKAMLSGLTISIVQELDNQILQLCTPTPHNPLTLTYNQTQLDQNKNIIQLYPSLYNNTNNKNPLNQTLQLIKQNFLTWSYIYNVSEYSIPCLVVSLSDIMSSEMMGLREGLERFMRYIKVVSEREGEGDNQDYEIIQKNQNQKKTFNDCIKKLKLLLVITNVNNSKNLNKQNIILTLKTHFVKHSSFLTETQLQIILNSQIQLIFTPFLQQQNKQSKQQYQYDMLQFIQKVQTYSFYQDKQNQVCFEYQNNSEQEVKLCEEIVSMQYQEAGERLEEGFKTGLRAKQREYQNQLNNTQISEHQAFEQIFEAEDQLKQLNVVCFKLDYMDMVSSLITELKKAKKQQNVFKFMSKLFQLLNFTQQDRTFIQLIIYCQCMKKNQLSQEQFKEEQNINQENVNVQIVMEYLSSSLIFKKLQVKIDQEKIQVSDSINTIIQSMIQSLFEKPLKAFYESILEQNQSNNVIFNEVYHILSKLMNLDQILLHQLKQKPLSDKSKLYEEYLLKFLNDLLQFSGGKSSKFYKEFYILMKGLRYFYWTINQKRLKLINLMGRIRESIYFATKGKKTVEMSKVQESPQQKLYNEKSSKKKQTDIRQYYQKTQTSQSLNNTTIIYHNNDMPKVIHNRNSQKNEKLLNYINNKKKLQEQGRVVLLEQSFQQQVRVQRQQKQKQQKNQISILIDQQSKFQLPKYYNDEKIQQGQENNDSQKDQYFSFPDEQDYDDQEIQTKVQEYKNYPSNNTRSKGKNTYEIDKINDKNISKDYFIPVTTMNQYFNDFVDMLKRQILLQNIVKLPLAKFINLRDLSTNMLDLMVVQKNFLQIGFNITDNFIFNQPMVLLHTSLVIFSRVIQVQQFMDLNFKIHYHNRKPIKINLIMIAEEFMNLDKLRIQDNKFGRVCMIKLLNHHTKNFEILPGYYTKNAKTKTKVEQLRLKELVEIYCKLLK